MRQANPWQGYLFLEFFSFFFFKKKFFSASPGLAAGAFCPFANGGEGAVALEEAELRPALLRWGVLLLVAVLAVEF